MVLLTRKFNLPSPPPSMERWALEHRLWFQFPTHKRTDGVRANAHLAGLRLR